MGRGGDWWAGDCSGEHCMIVGKDTERQSRGNATCLDLSFSSCSVAIRPDHSPTTPRRNVSDQAGSLCSSFLHGTLHNLHWGSLSAHEPLLNTLHRAPLILTLASILNGDSRKVSSIGMIIRIKDDSRTPAART